MKIILGAKIIIPAMILGIGAAAPVFAQEGSVPASESMHSAGSSAENAASDTGQAIKHAYHGTVTAASDTTITAKVKHALHENKETHASTVHVRTEAGVVTLTGTVPSANVSMAAEQVAQQTEGVKQVHNELKTAPMMAQ